MSSKKNGTETLLASEHPDYHVFITRKGRRWTSTVTSVKNGKKILSSTSQKYSRRVDATVPILDLLCAAMAGKVRVVSKIIS